MASPFNLNETRYAGNDSFCDSDLLGLTRCRVASNFSDAELHILHNIRVSYLTSYVTQVNYHTVLTDVFHVPLSTDPLIHVYLTRILKFLSELRAHFTLVFATELFIDVI